MNLKKLFLPLAAAFTILLIVTSTAKAALYASDALHMCAEIIIPTLFPFFVCSGILIYSGFCRTISSAFKFCMKPLFNVSPAGSGAFVLGIISGYPLGAVTAGELYKNSYITKSEAERLLAFCNNSGPLFILSSIGASMYSRPEYGVLLYCVHIIAAVSVGIIFRFYRRHDYTAPDTVMSAPQRSAGEIFSLSLNTSVQNILTVCGAVLIFSVASRLLLDLIPMPPQTDALVSGIFEFVTGTVKISNLTIPLMRRLSLTAFVVGFAGLGVHMQVIAVIAKYELSLLPYLAGKLLHGIISFILIALYFMKHPITTAVFAPSVSKTVAAASAAEISACAILLLISAAFFARYLLKANKVPNQKKRPYVG